MAAPRHHTRRTDRPTRGGAVGKIALAKGRPLMPWQRDAADVALEFDPATGLPAYGIVVVSTPRQSGKTTLESDVADHRALTIPRARVWYTAQTGKDASAWMRDEHFPSLEAATIFGRPGSATCRYARSKRAGAEGINWKHGSTFRVFPPLRDALHGKQSDLVFVDEAWALSPEKGADVRQAVRPTMATRPGAQLWIVSTMGDDGSSYFDGYVDQGRAALNDPNSRVCFIDYGLREDDDPEDLDLVAERHPAYGETITMQSLVDAREDFRKTPNADGTIRDDPAGWARAYANVPTRTRETAIPAGVWAAAGRSDPGVPDLVGLGIDVTPDLRRAALAAGWRDTDGIPGLNVAAGDGFVAVLHAGRNDRDFPELVASVARARRVGVSADRASAGALEVMDALARNHPDIAQTLTTTAQHVAACGQLDRGIREDTVHHLNDPGLTDAVAVATKRHLMDGGFAWGRKGSSGSIVELVAATVALGSFDRQPPRRSVKILTATRAGA